MSWYEIWAGGTAFARIAEFDAAGNLVTIGYRVRRCSGSYDAFSLAFNPVTGTFRLVGLDRRNDNVLGLELNVRGFPFNGENTISVVPRSPFRPSRYNRVTSSMTSRVFNSTYSMGFSSLASVMAVSSAAGGGPGGSFDAPPLLQPAAHCGSHANGMPRNRAGCWLGLREWRLAAA